MLLERISKDNLIEALYESSNIMASTYDTTNNQLKIVFKGGAEYIYENVPITDYHKLELADSQGVAFNKYLRSYPFEKGGKVDINMLQERIREVKQQEIDGISNDLVETARQLVSFYDEGASIDEGSLTRLKGLMTLRETKINDK